MIKREDAAEALLRLIDAHGGEFAEHLAAVIGEGPREPGAPEPGPADFQVADVRFTPNEATGTDVLVTFASEYSIVFRAG